MAKRVQIVVALAAAIAAGIGCLFVLLPDDADVMSEAPVMSKTPVWPGPRDVELESERFSLEDLHGRLQIAPSPDARELVSLYGVYNNGRAEQNVLVEKTDDGVRLQAWWVTPYGDVWLIDTSMSNAALDQLWSTLDEHHAFALRGESRAMSHAMTYWLTLEKGGSQHRAKVYGVGWHSSTTIFAGDSPISPDWHAVVAAILDLRSQYAHEVRPAGLAAQGKSVWTGNLQGEVLVAELAAQQVAVLEGAMQPRGQEELNWEAVLDAGGYRNGEIIEKIALLLDDPREDVSAAACAVMSWVSGQPPNADRRHWQDWWRREAAEYRAAATASEIPCGAGVIRNLGGRVKGFVGVETDDHGNVWALAATQTSWDNATYKLYKLDRRADKFVPTESSRSYACKFETPPPVRFFRRVAETGINFPDYHNGVWVSPDGRWGAAILGQETKYHADSVVVLDFDDGRMGRPLRTDHQYALPVVSADGAFVAVAKGWNWAKPNSAVVIHAATGEEQQIPIPAADRLAPIAFVDRSAQGPGFYLTRGDGPESLWWCSPDGRRAKQLLALSRELSTRLHRVNVTVDGARVFGSRQTSEEHDQEYGWIQVRDGDFEPVIPPSMWPTSIDATTDGDRVVFVDRGKVYEWSDGTDRPR